MRSKPAFAEIAERLRSPLSSRVQTTGRYVAGTIAAVGAVAVLNVGGQVAFAKQAGPPASRGPSQPAAMYGPKAPVNSAINYTVADGDTLTSIAAKYQVSIGALTTINALSNPDIIIAGKQILVPVSAEKAAVQQKPLAKVVPGTVKVPDSKVPSKPTPGGPLPADLVARPERLKLRPVFAQAAAQYHVPLDLLQAMTWNESGWQNGVVSNTGAVGIGQLMPATVEFVNNDLLRARLDPNRSDHNIKMSAAFLHYLLTETNNDPKLALAAYYQGLNSVRTKGLYKETERYIDTVLAVQYRFF